MIDCFANEVFMCGVEFAPHGKTYSYLTSDNSYAPGDIVVVLAGEHNHEAVVRIVTQRSLDADELPLVTESLKNILRFANETEREVFFRQKPRKQKWKSRTKKLQKPKRHENHEWDEVASPSDGIQEDGSLVVSYSDSGGFYGDVEVTYILDAENVRRLYEYLSKRHYGSNVESMLVQECGQDYRKRGLTELFEEAGVKYERFVWIS